MTETTIRYIALSISFSIALVLFIIVLLSPKTDSKSFYMSEKDELSPWVNKTVNALGGDLLAILPDDFKKKSIHDKELEEVFKYSGNPWKLNPSEFFIVRIAYAFVFGTATLLTTILLALSPMLIALITLGVAFLGWNLPLSHYKRVAKEREADFKRNFPELLDYLTMTMSSGRYTLENAIARVLPYLPESAVKEEFALVDESIQAGMSTSDALRALGERIPSASLQAFIVAVENAHALSAPMSDLMRVRAKNTRQDLLNEIELTIQDLPDKVMVRIGLPTIGFMLAVFMIPVIVALVTTGISG